MNKTKEQRHNEMLDKIFTPELERLKKVEAIAHEILNKLNEKVEIDYCGCEEWQLINIIQRAISQRQ